MIRGSLQRQLLWVVLIAAVPAFMAHFAFQIYIDMRTARDHTTTDVRDVAIAAMPLLKSALIVGDLATAQELLDEIMSQGQFHTLRLVVPYGHQPLAEGKSGVSAQSGGVPAWFVEWLDLRFPEQRFPIQVGGENYGVLVAEPSSLFLVADLWERFWVSGAIWLCTLAVFIFLVSVTLRRSLKPLDDLADAAHQLGAGDLTRRVPVSTVPELAETASAFNRMAENLLESRNKLEQRVHEATSELENLIARIPAGVYKLRFVADGTVRYDFVSQRWCEITGLDSESVARQPWVLLTRLHADERDGFRKEFSACGAALRPFHWEGRMCAGARARWLRNEALPIRLANGDVLWEGILYDISESKCAEEALRASEEKLRGLYELSPLGIALTDMQGHYIEFNESFRQICGYTADELRRLDYWTLTPRKYEAAEQEQLASLRRSGRYGPFEKEYRRRGGSRVPLRLNGMLVKGPNGEDRIWSIVENISRQKDDEAILQLTIRELDNLIARIPAGVFKLRMMKGGAMRFDFVSPRWCELLGVAAEEAYRDPMVAFNCIHPEETERFLRLNEIARESLEPFGWEGRLRDGLNVRWLHIESIPTVLDNGDILWEGIQYDITATKERESELDHIAHYDALTGIPNRILLADRLRQAMAQARRTETFLAVCYLDLDGFKPVNDSLGHEAGDVVLVEIARRLHGNLRGGDTVARIGGDEFVILLVGIVAIEECEMTLRRVLEAIEIPIPIGMHSVTVTASMGVTLYSGDNVDPDLLLRDADQAMYQAKLAGRNQFHFFNAGRNTDK